MNRQLNFESTIQINVKIIVFISIRHQFDDLLLSG